MAEPRAARAAEVVSNHGGQWWPSSEAKKALAVRKIACPRRSSAFSRSSWRIRAASPLVIPGRFRNRSGPA